MLKIESVVLQVPEKKIYGHETPFKDIKVP